MRTAISPAAGTGWGFSINRNGSVSIGAGFGNVIARTALGEPEAAIAYVPSGE